MKKKILLMVFFFMFFFLILQIGSQNRLQSNLNLNSATSSVYKANINDTLTYNITTASLPGLVEGDLWKIEVLSKNYSEVTGSSGNIASGEVLWVNTYLKNSTSPDFVLNKTNWQLVYNETHTNLTGYDSIMINSALNLPVFFGGYNLNQTINATYYNLRNEFNIPVNNTFFNSTTHVTFWDGFINGSGADSLDFAVQLDFNETTFEPINLSIYLWSGGSWGLGLSFELIDKNFTQQSPPTPPAPAPNPMTALIGFVIAVGLLFGSITVLGIYVMFKSRKKTPSVIKIIQNKNSTTVKVPKNHNIQNVCVTTTSYNRINFIILIGIINASAIAILFDMYFIINILSPIGYVSLWNVYFIFDLILVIALTSLPIILFNMKFILEKRE